ncbi:MAG: hydroxymethylbilane synthase [Halobacteriales archaeon]
MSDDPVRLATRGSDLALAQARTVADAIEDGRRRVELVAMETTGDELDEALIHELGTTGAFVRSLDREVLDGTVDAAVHSMKDVPTDQPEALVVAAVPPRATATDVLVTPEGLGLDELEAGAVVGTASLRRRAQVLRERDDLEVRPVRGNVDTRLAKLYAAAAPDAAPEALADRVDAVEADEPYDALVLAAAGLDRAGLAGAVPTASLERAVPAPGQGALAVVARDGDLARWLNDRLDDPRSRVEVTVERRVLGALGGGCVAPIGVHAVIQGEHVQTRVQVLDRDGVEAIDVTRQLAVQDHLDGASALADALLERGAGDLVERAARSGPGPGHRG